MNKGVNGTFFLWICLIFIKKARLSIKLLCMLAFLGDHDHLLVKFIEVLVVAYLFIATVICLLLVVDATARRGLQFLIISLHQLGVIKCLQGAWPRIVRVD